MVPTLTLNAVQTRALADYAASLRNPRGDPLYITATLDDDGNLTLGNTPGGPDDVQPDNAVLRAGTRDVAADRPALTTAIVGTGTATVNLLGKYDAVFWSESAVEKFVMAYYASKSLWYAGHVLSVLSEQWYGYVPGGPKPVGTAGSVPFAVAHMPSSDYVTVKESIVVDVTLNDPSAPTPADPRAKAGADLVLLALDPVTGGIIETPLSHFL